MFDETLDLSLRLTLGSNTVDVRGGNLKNVRVDLHTWGWQAEVELFVYTGDDTDTLLSQFCAQNLIQAQLDMQGVYNLPTPAPEVLSLKGPVSSKSLCEIYHPGPQATSLACRRYRLCFADPAQALWSQHHPILLAAEKKLSELISKQTVLGMDIDVSWKPLNIEHPVTCLHLQKPVSFYDFICWLADKYAGALFFDYPTRAYLLSDIKPDPTLPGFVDPREIASIDVAIGAIPRATRHVLNSYADKPKDETIEQLQAVEPIRADTLLRTPLPAVVARRKTVEKHRLALPEPALELTCSRYPTVTWLPGSLLRFEKSTWSTRAHAWGSAYRVTRAQLKVEAKDPGDRPEDRVACRMELLLQTEHEDDTRRHLPAFRTPQWPAVVEGRIVSDTGEDDDRSWQTYPDSQTSLEQYKLDIPLWNVQIVAPFEPHIFPGQIYFPLFKHQRVLVALDFLAARILRHLDWGADVRTPVTGQGHHILMGANATSETSLKHEYASDQPRFELKRVFGQDTEMVAVEEGVLCITTAEDSSLKKASETFDVTPKKLASQAELKMQGGAAISGLTAEYEVGAGAVTSELESAVTGVGGALEEMENSIADQASEVEATLDALGSTLGGAGSRLTGAASSAKSELQGLLGL